MNTTVVGAFVLLLGSLLLAAVLWLASGGLSQKPTDLYLAIEDESVAGLNLNAPVKFNGVGVGKVKRIELDPSNPERVRLIFAIERGTPIKQDTVAILKTQGLTGIAYVELSGATRDSPLLRATAEGQYPVIRTKPSLSARLENVLTAVLIKLDRTTSNIDALLSSENRAALSHALADLAALSHTLAERRTTLDAAITSGARTLAQTERASAELAPLIAQLKQSAQAVAQGASSVGQMGESAAQASRRAGEVLGQLGQTLQHANAETLPQLQALMAELDALSLSLRRLSEQTERSPSGLLLGRSPVPAGPGETPTKGPAP